MDESTTDATDDPAAETESESESEAEQETDAEWMMPADKPILEFLQSEDAFEPAQLDEAGLCPAKFGAYRCRELTKYGLLNNPIPGVYEVSELGEQYLDGELDPSELEPDE